MNSNKEGMTNDKTISERQQWGHLKAQRVPEMTPPHCLSEKLKVKLQQSLLQPPRGIYC